MNVFSIKFITNIKKRIGLLRKEIDKIEKSEYLGVAFNSDEEEEAEENESDREYFSDDETVRKVIDYYIDTMFKIVQLRTSNKWSMATIHSRFRKVSEGEAGKKQISR